MAIWNRVKRVGFNTSSMWSQHDGVGDLYGDLVRYKGQINIQCCDIFEGNPLNDSKTPLCFNMMF